jgi:hypothetical protein
MKFSEMKNKDINGKRVSLIRDLTEVSGDKYAAGTLGTISCYEGIRTYTVNFDACPTCGHQGCLRVKNKQELDGLVAIVGSGYIIKRIGSCTLDELGDAYAEFMGGFGVNHKNDITDDEKEFVSWWSKGHYSVPWEILCNWKIRIWPEKKL